ncbi:MAG: SDR family oxidoreductase [Acidobacteria bacterium]|nr:SDR family oxidoreductase [Acidobacteriota bacterium]MCB9377881.1 SDR family oxidoreductase [Holophagales bacterium]
MSERRWLLVLGASSGFGEAAVREFAAAGWDVFGVHLDRRTGQEHVEKLASEIRAGGAEAHFFNINAADHEKRRAAVAEMAKLAAGRPVGVLLHSLAFGALKPFIAEEEKDALSPQQMDMTLDVMAHSLVYWSQDLVRAGLLADGSRIYAMTSAGDRIIWKAYGAVSAAKCALESHIRQLAVELAPRGITANAIKAGVTDTPALRKIPGNAEIVESARARNPAGRLTTPEDVARCLVSLAGSGTAWLTGTVLQVDGGEDVAG